MGLNGRFHKSIFMNLDEHQMMSRLLQCLNSTRKCFSGWNWTLTLEFSQGLDSLFCIYLLSSLITWPWLLMALQLSYQIQRLFNSLNVKRCYEGLMWKKKMSFPWGLDTRLLTPLWIFFRSKVDWGSQERFWLALGQRADALSSEKGQQGQTWDWYNRWTGEPHQLTFWNRIFGTATSD